MQSATACLKRKQKKQRQKQRRLKAHDDAVLRDDADHSDGAASSDDVDAAGVLAVLSAPGGAHARAMSALGERASRLNDLGFDEDQLGFSADDLESCLRVVSALGSDLAAFRSQPFKGLRGAMHPIVEEQMKNYGVKGNALGKRKRNDKSVAEITSLKEQDKEWVNRAALRAKRLSQLEELNNASPALTNGGHPLLLTHMGEVEDAVAKIKMHRVADGSVELAAEEEEAAAKEGEARQLNIPINCYTCKRPFRELHFFYDQLCPACASLNYQKRNEVCDLAGRVAVVTGARVKIGYRIALKLLRCGATVIATSRFAADCARRYALEKDFEDWQDRLQCFGLDFRDLAELENFCSYIKNTFTRLDIIINNACQTIRRPAQYYEHLLVKERASAEDRPVAVRALLESNDSFSKSHMGGCSLLMNDIEGVQRVAGTGAAGGSNGMPGVRVEVYDEEDEGETVYDESTKRAAHGGPRAGSHSAAQRSQSAQELPPVSQGAKLVQGKGDKVISRTGGAGAKRITQDVAVCCKSGDGGTSSQLKESGSQGTVASRRYRRSGGAAEMSQMAVLEEDLKHDTSAFPVMESGEAVVDVNEQQLDLRSKNSWMLKLNEVSTGELAEVMAINAIAPAVINARLKPLMEASPEKMRFIVNVSAMEGKFYRFKSDQHPHTNMAKAALNMMTRTSAQDYVKSGIYMTAVDTGWINDEKPMEIAARHGERHNFQTPIDEIDAAARVLDPVIAPVLAAQRGQVVTPPSGVFLKDFVKCEW